MFNIYSTYVLSFCETGIYVCMSCGCHGVLDISCDIGHVEIPARHD